jgi:2-(3-amino-3-carboxypropyl)histidine synthase
MWREVVGIETFDFEENRLKDEIIRRGAKRVLIQLPEGLKAEGPRLAAVAEEAGATAIVSADPCYGACDLALLDAKSLKIDLIVHYGHSQMIPQGRAPTIYIEARAKVDAKKAIKKAMPLIKRWKNIGLVTTVQHIHALEEVKELLHDVGKNVVVGKAEGFAKYDGQVVGCDYATAISISKEVDAFLFVGGGKFHAIGVSLATAKPTIVADPYERRAYSVDEEAQRILRQRWASISEAEKAEKFGVLIGLKIGQKRVKEALEIKEKLKKSGREVTLLALREITPEALMQFPSIDAFVNTACPRISLDDASKFQKSVLTFNETLVMLRETSWEELCRESWFGR